MRCSDALRLAAHYRELAPDERARVGEHARGCPSCAEALEAYTRQDALLAGMSKVTPSASLRVAVMTRTADVGRSGAMGQNRGLRAAAVVLIVVLLMTGGTVGVSASSLPGDWLYPVKRAAESVRLAITLPESARQDYAQHLAEVRLAEVEAVVAQGRTARVEFDALVTGVDGALLHLGGITVLMPSSCDAMPVAGAVVRVVARAQQGRLMAESVMLIEKPAPSVDGGADSGETGGPGPTRAPDTPDGSAGQTPGDGGAQGRGDGEQAPGQPQDPTPVPRDGQVGGGQDEQLQVTPNTGKAGLTSTPAPTSKTSPVPGDEEGSTRGVDRPPTDSPAHTIAPASAGPGRDPVGTMSPFSLPEHTPVGGR